MADAQSQGAQGASEEDLPEAPLAHDPSGGEPMTPDDAIGPGTLDLIGETILVTLTDYQEAVGTKHGPTDVAYVEFVVLTGRHRGWATEDSDIRRVFFGEIASTLIRDVDLYGDAVATITGTPVARDAFSRVGVVVTTDREALKRARAQARRDALVGVQLTLDGVPS